MIITDGKKKVEIRMMYLTGDFYYDIDDGERCVFVEEV